MEFIDLKAQQDRIRPQIEAAMLTVLDHGRYILGPEVTELEQQLAKFVGVNHCISAASGTDALLLCLMVSDIKPGDEIITTPFTFVATAETIALLGAKPVFVDIDPKTFNLDASKVETAITTNTKAILAVGLYGQTADMEELNTIANKHDLILIEDGAQSFGAEYRGRKSCATSVMGCTSFFPSKPLGCYGDGGAVFTDDPELAKVLRETRIHGQDRRYHHARLGINGRMDTLQAAILLVKLNIFEDEIEQRNKVANRYNKLLEDSAIATPMVAKDRTSVYAQYTIRVKQREQIRLWLQQKDIPTAVHYPIALYRQPAFFQPDVHLPCTDSATEEVLSLPMHPYLTNDQQDKVCHALIDAQSQYS